MLLMYKALSYCFALWPDSTKLTFFCSTFFFPEQKMQLFKKKEQEMAQKEARLQKAENDLKIKHAELKVLLVYEA